MHPIELRVNKWIEGERAKRTSLFPKAYYTIDKVWPGVGNVSHGQRSFNTARDAAQWAKTEWPGVPLIRNY
jgi:hypothetical protein